MKKELNIGNSGLARFFINGATLTVVALAVRCTSVLFSAYVTRAAGEEGVGLFTLIMNVYAFAVTFCSAGISLTVTRLVAEDMARGGARCPAILRSAALYVTLIGGAATFLMLSCAPLLARFAIGSPATASAVRSLSLTLLPIAFGSLFSGYFVAVRRVTQNALISVVSQAARVIMTFAVLNMINSADAVACARALCAAILVTEGLTFFFGVFLYALDRKKHPAPMLAAATEPPVSAWREVCATALPLCISACIRSALVTAEHVMIPWALVRAGESRAGALALYGLLHGMALPIILFPIAPLTSFSGLLVPEFAGSLAAGDDRRMERMCRRATEATLVYSVGVAVFVLLFSEEIGYILYDSYSAGKYIAILAPVIPIMYLDHLTDAMLKGIGEQVYSMWVNIADAAISVVLVLVLIPLMGISGYAAVILGMEGFNFVLSALRLCRRVRVRADLVISFFRPLLAASVAAGLTRQLFSMNGELTTPRWLVLKGIFAAVCYVALLLSLRPLFSFRRDSGKG